MKNIIEERDEGIIKRQKFKKQFDNAINLSNRDGVRLIDEGAVVTGEDYVAETTNQPAQVQPQA